MPNVLNYLSVRVERKPDGSIWLRDSNDLGAQRTADSRWLDLYGGTFTSADVATLDEAVSNDRTAALDGAAAALIEAMAFTCRPSLAGDLYEAQAAINIALGEIKRCSR